MKKKLLVVLLATVVAIAFSFTGCGSKDKGGSSAADKEKTKAGGKTLIIKDGSWSGIDLFQVSDWNDMQCLVADSVLTKDPKTGKAMPGIASKSVWSKDGKTWTLTFPKGMKYSTGKELEPEDFVASVKYGLKVSPYKDGYSNIKNMEIKGRKVIVHFKKFHADTEFNFMTCFTGIIDKDEIDSMTKDDMLWGCHPYGAYYVDKYEPGAYVILKANPGYKTNNPKVKNKGVCPIKRIKIVFSGDLGMKNRPILRDPVTIKKADCVIMETTYGNRNHAQNSMSVKQLIDIILKTTRRGGTVVIPSFAVGRTQELIYELNRFYEKSSPDYRQELDKVDVIVDSPMATTATEVFRNNAQVFDEETKAYIMKGDNPLDFKNLRFTRSTEESRALNTDHTPKVIISASGMCEAGRIRHHLKHNLWDARNSVIFVGYQGEGTLGRSLIEGKKDITLFGEEVHVNAEIYNLEGFSGHADQNGLLEWISGFQQPPRQIFLVHGEEQSKKDFAKLIHDKLGYDPIPVLGNSEFELDMNDVRVLNMTEAVQTAAEDEDVQKVRSKISEIETELEGILYNTSLAMSQSMSEEKLVRINNVVQELEKATINLGTAVNQREEPPRP